MGKSLEGSWQPGGRLELHVTGGVPAVTDWDDDQDDGPGLRFGRRVSLPVGLALMAAMLLLVIVLKALD